MWVVAKKRDDGAEKLMGFDMVVGLDENDMRQSCDDWSSLIPISRVSYASFL